MLFGVAGTDVATFAGTAALLVVVAFLASLPAGAPGDADRPDGGAAGRIRTVHRVIPSND